MVLVFILCTIVILITLFIFMVILSTLKFQIKNLEITNMNETITHILPNYEFKISLYLFNKIKWFSIKLNNKKIKNMYKNIKLDKIDLKKLEQDFKSKDLKYIKTLEPKISYLNFRVKIGVENVVLTSFIIFAISTIISILLPYTIKKYDKNKYYYQILPLYINKNSYEIKLNCIIEVKMVHIINIIYVLLKKRRVDKYGERASNRRSYGYSYE